MKPQHDIQTPNGLSLIAENLVGTGSRGNFYVQQTVSWKNPLLNVPYCCIYQWQTHINCILEIAFLTLFLLPNRSNQTPIGKI